MSRARRTPRSTASTSRTCRTSSRSVGLGRDEHQWGQHRTRVCSLNSDPTVDLNANYALCLTLGGQPLAAVAPALQLRRYSERPLLEPGQPCRRFRQGRTPVARSRSRQTPIRSQGLVPRAREPITRTTLERSARSTSTSCRQTSVISISSTRARTRHRSRTRIVRLHFIPRDGLSSSSRTRMTMIRHSRSPSPVAGRSAGTSVTQVRPARPR